MAPLAVFSLLSTQFQRKLLVSIFYLSFWQISPLPKSCFSPTSCFLGSDGARLLRLASRCSITEPQQHCGEIQVVVGAQWDSAAQPWWPHMWQITVKSQAHWKLAFPSGCVRRMHMNQVSFPRLDSIPRTFHFTQTFQNSEKSDIQNSSGLENLG